MHTKRVFIAMIFSALAVPGFAEIASKDYVDTSVTTVIRRGNSVAAVGSATVPVYVDTNGTVQQITSYSGKSDTAGTADKAVADGNGANIANTYATKAEIQAMDYTDSGTGYVTAVTQVDGKITAVTKSNVKIPVNSATGTPTASIWVQ